MKKSGIFLFFVVMIMFFSMPFISAQPPFQSSDALTGIQLESPIIEYITVNQSFEFHVHAHNFSNGMLLKNDSINYCSIHLYNPVGGSHLIQENMSWNSNNIDWEYTASPGNFTEL